jgi:hypothetical protein
VKQGFYLNAFNADEAAARVRTFERWTSENGLKWAAVGLDIEPDFTEPGRVHTNRRVSMMRAK